MLRKLRLLLLLASQLLLATGMKRDCRADRTEILQTKLLHSYATVFRAESRKTNDVELSVAVSYVEKFSTILHVENADDTLLAMYHIESRFDQNALGDDKKCFGVGQFVLTDEPQWRAFWAIRGVKLGPITNIETQVAFSVAEFQTKLVKANGDLRDAVRRYNGAGPRARNYAHLVMRARRIIFQHPYVQGEHVSVFGQNVNRV